MNWTFIISFKKEANSRQDSPKLEKHFVYIKNVINYIILKTSGPGINSDYAR